MNPKTRTILAVDDAPGNLDILKGVLSPHYQVKLATSGRLVFKILEHLTPDLILLDVMMPEMDGYEVCKIIKSEPRWHKIPIIFVTAMSEASDEQKGFDVGAIDYVTKPIHPAIVLARVKTHLALADQQRTAEELVAQRIHELEQSQRDAILMLGYAGHYNDTDTGVHIWRMAEFTSCLATKYGWCVERADMLKLAAAMHDTGKIGISDEILKAPRKLTDEEWVIMKTHTSIGYEILKHSQTPLFELAAEVALNHHEKWNGTGYPRGLTGKDIPESGRLVAVADVFDALTMVRPYKAAWPLEKAINTIKQDAGTHFDPELVELLLENLDEILAIKTKWDQQEHL